MPKKYVKDQDLRVGDIVKVQYRQSSRCPVIDTIIITELEYWFTNENGDKIYNIYGYRLKDNLYYYVSTHQYVREILSRGNDISKYERMW